MNPWGLSAEGLVIFGLVLHLIGDFGLQSDWMAANKMNRRPRFRMHTVIGERTRVFGAEAMAKDALQRTHNYDRWWDRHPAAYVHALIHTFLLTFVFGWAAFPIGVAHLIIDCRWIVVKWSKLMKQTPANIFVMRAPNPTAPDAHLMDVGSNVRLWLDQTFHIVCLAVAAILVTL